MTWDMMTYSRSYTKRITVHLCDGVSGDGVRGVRKPREVTRAHEFLTYHTVCTTIKHIIGTGRSSAATSQARPKKLRAGILLENTPWATKQRRA